MADGQDTVGAGAAGFGTTVEELARASRHVLDVDALSEALRAIGDAIQGSGRTYQQQEEAQYTGLSAIRAALG
jgi:hypothetical protein